MKKIFYPLALFALTLPAGARDLKGKVTDAKTGEQIIGAIVRLKSNPNVNTTTGYDGSFTLTVDDATEPVLLCSYIGYESREIRPTADNVSITLTAMDLTLGTATVQGRASGNTEIRAREIERNSMNVVNVMSAKAIELSPDLTVANVLQRMSGLVLEKNESGEGQYAILRGMDKRYNYTLVNGVKIPSPDNKNRFVPLDIFPSELLDRLEVTKSLTADMEADGIGGAINMVMKDAPRMRQLDANFSVGYNAQYFNRSFASYGASGVNHESPYERFGASHVTTDADFDMKPLKMEHHSPIPDLRAGISYGDRFADDRLGLIVAANVQNYYTGKKADLYYQEDGQTPKETNRLYSEQQTRFGAHAKLDYAWNGMSGLSVTLRTDTEGRVTRVLNSGEVYRKARAAYDSACKESRYMNSVADAGVDVRRILRADDSYEFAKGIIEDVKALFQLYGNAFAEGETRRHSDQTKDSCESDTSTSLLLDRNSGEYVIFVNADNYIPYFEVESQATDLAGECFNDEVARRLRVISAEEPDRSDRNYAVYNSQLYFRFSSDGWPQEIVSEETTRIVGAGRTERTSVTKLSEKM